MGGWTGFICACENNSVEVVKLLIETGVNLEAKDKWDRTGFMLAVQREHVEVINLLIDAGVHIELSNPKNEYERTKYRNLKDQYQTKINKCENLKENMKRI